MHCIKVLLITLLMTLMMESTTPVSPIDAPESAPVLVDQGLEVTPQPTPISSQTYTPTLEVIVSSHDKKYKEVIGGFAWKNITSLASAPNGTVWIATQGYGITSFDGETWVTYTTKDGLSSNDVRSVVVAPDGAIWAGTSYGVSKFDGETWTAYTSDDGLFTNDIAAIVVAPDGIVWVGTWYGIARFDGEIWEVYVPEDSKRRYVRSIAVAPDGSVWTGGYGFVQHFDGDTLAVYVDDGGLLSGNWITSIAVTPDDTVWVGTENADLLSFSDGIWNRHDYPFSYIPAIVMSNGDAVWMEVPEIGERIFGLKDNLSFNSSVLEIFKGFQDFERSVSAAVAADGSVWFGIAGYMVVHFDGEVRTDHMPDLALRDEIDQQELDRVESYLATLTDVERIEVIYRRGYPWINHDDSLPAHDPETIFLSVTDPLEIQQIVDGFKAPWDMGAFSPRGVFDLKMDFYLADGQIRSFVVDSINFCVVPEGVGGYAVPANSQLLRDRFVTELSGTQ